MPDDRKSTAIDCFKLGMQAFELGDFKQAKNVFVKVIELYPSWLRPYIQVALCEKALGQLEKVHRTMGIVSRQVVAAKQRARAAEWVEKWLKNEPQMRAQFYEGVLEIDRTTAEPFLGLASAYEQLGEWKKGVAVLLSALETEAKHELVLQKLNEAYSVAGEAEKIIFLKRYENGKISRKELMLFLTVEESNDFEGKVENPTESSDNLSEMIDALEKQMNEDESVDLRELAPLIQVFRQKSQKILGESARAHMDMGVAYWQMGLFEEARLAMNGIKETDPCYAEAQYHLAEIALDQGDWLKSLECSQSSVRRVGTEGEIAKASRYVLIRALIALNDYIRAAEVIFQLEELEPDYRQLKQLKASVKLRMSGEGT